MHTENHKIRLTLVHNIFAPYREGLFKAIDKLPGVRLTVYYCSDKCPGRNWRIKPEGYKYQVLKGVTIGRNLHINPEIIWRIVTDRPDVLVVGGYSYPTSMMAILTAKFLRIPLVLWSASSLLDSRLNLSNWRQKSKYVAKRLLIRCADKYIVPGQKAIEYLKELGAGAKDISIMRNSFDLDFFHQGADRARKDRDRIRKEFGLPASKLLLYVGHLTEKKGAWVLLKAYRIIRDKNAQIGLVIAGDGPEERELKEYCRHHRLKRVYFMGFRQKDEMPSLFGASDVFVFPSLQDTWGMVLNEAMASGLPIVTTDRVGGAYDLVEDGTNGLIVPAGDPQQLSAAVLKALAKSPREVRHMVEYSQNKISKYTHRDSATDLFQTIAGLSG
jgi:glycosyltransferase involved in cell wall biosynthesis